MPKSINFRLKCQPIKGFLWTTRMQTWLVENIEGIQKLNYKNWLLIKFKAIKIVGC